jgi:hypothetical protein
VAIISHRDILKGIGSFLSYPLKGLGAYGQALLDVVNFFPAQQHVRLKFVVAMHGGLSICCPRLTGVFVSHVVEIAIVSHVTECFGSPWAKLTVAFRPDYNIMQVSPSQHSNIHRLGWLGSVFARESVFRRISLRGL